MKNMARLLMAVLVFWAFPASAAQYTVTLAKGAATIDVYSLRSMKVVEISVTGDASDGTVSDIVTPFSVDGLIYRVETDPGATAPTALYDLTLTSSLGGADLMGTRLDDRSATDTERAAPTVTEPNRGGLTLAVANQSVVSATFTVRIFYFDTGR